MANNDVRIAFCVPLFNEEHSIFIIKRNLDLIFKFTPRASIFFNDNHSTDKTFEKILLIKKRWPQRIFLLRQSSNMGFSKNIAQFGRDAVSLIRKSGAEYFQLLGADDVITKKGLLHLIKQIKTNKGADLIISNWIYTKKRGKKTKVLGDFDIPSRKVCASLETFLSRKLYIPGGIMQYCIHKNKLHELKNYEKEISPHVGVFFQCFPGRVICAGPPGLCRVRKSQVFGWRSTAFGVISTHVMCFEMYIRLLKKSYKEKKIFRTTYKRLIKEYTRLSWLILKECHEGKWGKWSLSRSEKIATFFFMLKGLLRGSIFLSMANLRYLQKEAMREKERKILKAKRYLDKYSISKR